MIDLVLASASPRRTTLLSEWGFRHRVIEPRIEEFFDPASAPRELAVSNALAKAASVARAAAGAVVLGADTVVHLDGEVFGKPRNSSDAERILGRLSGRAQEVVTGVALVAIHLGREVTGAVGSVVHLREIPSREIRAYVATDEPMGKAGAYAIQETGDRFVERIDGSFTNVVGLPMEWVSRALEQEFGIRPAASPHRGCRGT